MQLKSFKIGFCKNYDIDIKLDIVSSNRLRLC